MPFVLPTGPRPVSIEHPSAARSGPGNERNRIGRHGRGSKEDTVVEDQSGAGGRAVGRRRSAWRRWAGVRGAGLARPARSSAATLRLTKHVVAQPGVSDPGRFDIRAAGAAVTTASNVGDGGTTGIVPVPAGPYLITESARPGTSLADYSAGDVLPRHRARPHGDATSRVGGALAIVVNRATPGTARSPTRAATRPWPSSKTGPPARWPAPRCPTS